MGCKFRYTAVMTQYGHAMLLLVLFIHAAPAAAAPPPLVYTVPGGLVWWAATPPGLTTVLPAAAVLAAGEEVELHCAARPAGSPPPAFTWWREGQPRLVLGNQANLTIAPLTRHHHFTLLYHTRPEVWSDVNM